MTNSIDGAFKQRLADLGSRIDAKIDDLERQGVLHGPAREAAADWKLQHVRLASSLDDSGKRRGELAADIEILGLTFERWLARIDKSADHHSGR